MMIGNILFALPAVCAVICLILYTEASYAARRIHKEYGRISLHTYYGRLCGRLYLRMSKIGFLRYIIYETGCRLSVFNTYSMESNRRTGAAVIAAYSLYSAAAPVCFFVLTGPDLFTCMLCACAACAVPIFIFCMISEIRIQRQIADIPNAARLIRARCILTGDISKAVGLCINDAGSSLRPELIRIYAAIKRNGGADAERTLREAVSKYGSGQMILFFELILYLLNTGADRGADEDRELVLAAYALICRRAARGRKGEMARLKILFALRCSSPDKDTGLTLGILKSASVYYKKYIERIIAAENNKAECKDTLFENLISKIKDTDMKIFAEQIYMGIVIDASAAVMSIKEEIFLTYPQKTVDKHRHAVEYLH